MLLLITAFRQTFKMVFCRSTLVLLVAVFCGCSAYLRFEETNQHAALTQKIADVNATLNKALDKAFIAKTVQAVASMDPTVRNLIASIYAVPGAAFTCLQYNMSRMSYPTITRMTLSTLPTVLSQMCPGYKSQFTAVENATIALKKRLDTYTPEVIANLPPGVYDLLTTAGNISLEMLNDPDMANNLTYQEYVIDEMVTQINGLNDTDRKDFAKQVPWTAPFITPNGKYSGSLRRTLELINTGLRNSFNTSELAPALTDLTLGVASKLPNIVKWAYNKIDGLPVSKEIYADTTIAVVANTVAELGNMFVVPAVNSYDMKKVLELLLGGRFLISDYVYVYQPYYYNSNYYDY